MLKRQNRQKDVVVKCEISHQQMVIDPDVSVMCYEMMELDRMQRSVDPVKELIMEF